MNACAHTLEKLVEVCGSLTCSQLFHMIRASDKEDVAHPLPLLDVLPRSLADRRSAFSIHRYLVHRRAEVFLFSRTKIDLQTGTLGVLSELRVVGYGGGFANTHPVQ